MKSLHDGENEVIYLEQGDKGVDEIIEIDESLDDN